MAFIRINTLAMAGALAIALLTTSANAVNLYEITMIGNLGTGDFANALGINDFGVVVGDSNLTPGADVGSFGHAWVWDPANPTMVDLGTLGGAASTARDINFQGLIVGDAMTGAGSDRHAFVIDPNNMPGVMQNLGTLGGGRSQAYAVNQLGEIVGSGQLANNDTHAMYIDYDGGGSMQSLGTLGGNPAVALDINGSSEIVGFSRVGSGFTAQTEAFYVPGPTGSMIGLGTLASGGEEEEENALAAGNSSAFAINPTGKIVGRSTPVGGGGFNQNAFFMPAHDQPMQDLGLLASGTSSIAKDITPSGRTVGTATTSGNSSSHGFVWSRNVGMLDLNNLIDPGDPLFTDVQNGDLVIDEGGATNSHGQIAATAIETATGARRAILLNPTVPFPVTEVEVELETHEGIRFFRDSDPHFSEALETVQSVLNDPLRNAEATAEAEQGPFTNGPVVHGRSNVGLLDVDTSKVRTFSRAVANFLVVSDDPNDPVGTPVEVGAGMTFHGVLDLAGRAQDTSISLVAKIHHENDTVTMFDGFAMLRRLDGDLPPELFIGGNCTSLAAC